MLDRKRLKQAFASLDDDFVGECSCGAVPSCPRGTANLRLTMKLKAFGGFERGERDMADAKALATELGIDDAATFGTLDVSIHGEAPSDTVRRRLASVLVRS